MDKLIRPVIFNVITIAALLFALVQMLSIQPGRITPSMTETIQILDEVDESLSDRLTTDQNRRRWFTNLAMITTVIAILANVTANYLGRRRQRVNVAKISRLEEELQRLRIGRP